MRRVIVAFFSALLAVIGCLAASGTAQAVPSKLVSCEVAKDATSCTVGGVTISVGDSGVSCGSVDADGKRVCRKNVSDNNWPGHNGNPGHHIPGPVGGPWNDRWDGHRWLTLDRGPRLDLCSYATYGDLIGRNGVYRDRIGRWVTSDRFTTYRRSCSNAPVVVSDDGDCVTYATARDSLRNYSNDYLRLRNLYHGDFRRLNVGERNNLDRLWGLSNRYRNDWNNRLVKMRTVCQDTTPPVTIINEAPDQVVTAPAPTTVQAPAPVIINQPTIKVPNTSAGIDNGDGSFPIARG